MSVVTAAGSVLFDPQFFPPSHGKYLVKMASMSSFETTTTLCVPLSFTSPHNC